MERTWSDNAFWTDNSKGAITAILSVVNSENQKTTQVVTVNKSNPDGSENPDFAELISQVSEEKIDQNTQERIQKKAQEAELDHQRREERARAVALEQLFEAKLKAFEIDDIKNCKDRVLKSKLRKAKNLIEVNAYATIIIMEQMKANEESEEQ